MLTLTCAGRAAATAGPATCMRASGNADSRCLERYDDVVARCRGRADAACEAAARADGGALSVALARSDDRSLAACSDAARARRSTTRVPATSCCAATTPAPTSARTGSPASSRPIASSLSGAFVGCQREVSRQLGHLRDATVAPRGTTLLPRQLPGRRLQPRAARRADRAASKRARGAASPAAAGRRSTRLGLGALDDLIDARRSRAPATSRSSSTRRTTSGRRPTPGPYPVGVRTLDARRPVAARTSPGTGPRPVTVEVYYPSTDGGDGRRAARRGHRARRADRRARRRTATSAIAPGPLPAGPLLARQRRHPLPVVLLRRPPREPRLRGRQPGPPRQHVRRHAARASSTRTSVDEPSARHELPDRPVPRLRRRAGQLLRRRHRPARVGASGHRSAATRCSRSPAARARRDVHRSAREGDPAAGARRAVPAPPSSRRIPSRRSSCGGSLDETTPFESQQQRPSTALPAGRQIVGLGRAHRRRPLHLLGLLRGAARPARASSAASTRPASRATCPGAARTTSSNYLSLNFFDAVLSGDPAALGAPRPGRSSAASRTSGVWRK